MGIGNMGRALRAWLPVRAGALEGARREVADLRCEVAALRDELGDMRSSMRVALDDEVQPLRDDLRTVAGELVKEGVERRAVGWFAQALLDELVRGAGGGQRSPGARARAAAIRSRVLAGIKLRDQRARAATAAGTAAPDDQAPADPAVVDGEGGAA